MKRLIMMLLLAASPALATAETLTVVTDRSLIDLRPLVTAYEDEMGVQVQIIRPREGVMNMLEEKYDSLAADIYLTEDLAKLRELRDAELTEPVYERALQTATQARLRDPENHWFAAEVLPVGRTERRLSLTGPAAKASGVALLITSQNVPEAIRFMEFMVSDRGRQIEANGLNN